MCGIVGIFNYAGKESIVSPEVLGCMTDEIKHRGPDDQGHYISEDRRVGFGFRRLSIIDLSSAGHQPMSNADGTIWIVFNGEIYNHQSIREDLQRRGYRYRSKTDTETILYAYQEYGIEFINKLYGMFAIAIWDATKQQLLLVRDRIGIKPVYYTIQNGALFFASEIKAILQHPDVARSLNAQGLYDYLSFLITPPGVTLFEGINKLEAGHYLRIDRSGNVSVEQYWDLNQSTIDATDAQLHDETFCIETIRALLRDGIKLRMMSDVPLGVLLSGGVDSTLIVSLMTELIDRPVETFSVGFREQEKYNEFNYARRMADLYKTNHHEILIDEDDFLDFLPDMVWHLDEPIADAVCVPTYYVSKLARDTGTTVILAGEGSDEQFSGYTHYLRDYRYHRYYYALLPGPLKKLAYWTFRTFKPDSPATEYARRAAKNDAPFFGAALSFSEETKPRLLKEEFLAGVEGSGRLARRYDTIAKQMPNGAGNGFLRRMIYYEFKSRLPELLLMRVDKMSMAVSVEARVPFLDHRLVEFAFRIPSELKIKGGETKYILKKAAEGIIPDEIIYRPKQGFNTPMREWLRGGKLEGFMRDRIYQSGLARSGIFERSFIDHMFERHTSRAANYHRELWNLLVLSMWYDRFLQ
ncbi:MAG: asparagine synthase (glutamine-hydrolyzing) [Bacteroidetes bacterium]|nr:asparagine synthase (glutamine-hydrolyzing) [Bacteroidota bacterium]